MQSIAGLKGQSRQANELRLSALDTRQADLPAHLFHELGQAALCHRAVFRDRHD
jgi:hypothetical protein